jgi:hypothetical protein
LNVAPTIFPSVTVNASVPDSNGIPQPWNAKVSSIEAGAGLPGFGATYTVTPQQIADLLVKHGIAGSLPIGVPGFPEPGPAMGPQDELTPFARSLQSKSGSIGLRQQPAVPFLDPSEQSPLGAGMAGWSASATRPNVFNAGAPPVPYLPDPLQGSGGLPGLFARVAGTDPHDPTQPPPPAGGLLELMQDYLRSNPDDGAAR